MSSDLPDQPREAGSGEPGGAPPQPIGPSGTDGKVPWERRGQLGLVPALLMTVRDSLFKPTDFFRGMEPAGSIGAALLYAVLVGWASALVGVFWETLLPFPWPGALSGLQDRSGGAAGIALGLMLVLVAVPIFVPLGVFVLSLVYHALLLLFGGPSRGLEGTVRSVAYAFGAQLLNVIPMCGALLVLVWGVVVQVIGLREVHRIETGKAVAVVLLPYLLCAVLVLGTLAALLVALPGTLRDILEHASR